MCYRDGVHLRSVWSHSFFRLCRVAIMKKHYPRQPRVAEYVRMNYHRSEMRDELTPNDETQTTSLSDEKGPTSRGNNDQSIGGDGQARPRATAIPPIHRHSTINGELDLPLHAASLGALAFGSNRSIIFTRARSTPWNGCLSVSIRIISIGRYQGRL